MTKIVSVVAFVVAALMLGYVALSNYVLWEYAEQGAEVASPSGFFTESILLMIGGYSLGIPAWIGLTRRTD